jgi:hypothetical protein
MSTACQCKIVQKKYDCLKDKISFNKQCAIVLKFLRVQVGNITQLLRCRQLDPNRLENIKLVEDACDRLFCVVSNNTYKCITVTVCKVKSDEVFDYQSYKLKIVSNENKNLKFNAEFTISKRNLNLVTNLSIVRCFAATFSSLPHLINELEAESAKVYL